MERIKNFFSKAPLQQFVCINYEKHGQVYCFLLEINDKSFEIMKDSLNEMIQNPELDFDEADAINIAAVIGIDFTSFFMG